MNHAMLIDESNLTDVPVVRSGWHFRDDITVVDNAENPGAISIPEITVADSWRTECINTCSIGIAIGRQGCQGRPQAVAAKPDFKAFPVQYLQIIG